MPDNFEYGDPPEEEIIDIDRLRSSDDVPSSTQAGVPRVKSHFRDRSDTPASVSPTAKVGRITPISPSPDLDDGISSAGRPTIPRFLMARLIGKTVDEYGDVVDSARGAVLGQVAGDLPAMVGRAVSDESGDVRDDNGELLGYVVHVTTDSERQAFEAEKTPATQSLDEFTNGHAGSLRVDADGRILDGGGNVVGQLNDKTRGGANSPQSDPGGGADGRGQPSKKNAETFRKEDVSPSDIFLDVKSTAEGIQLTIRIPTVFPDRSWAPKVQIS